MGNSESVCSSHWSKEFRGFLTGLCCWTEVPLFTKDTLPISTEKINDWKRTLRFLKVVRFCIVTWAGRYHCHEQHMDVAIRTGKYTKWWILVTTWHRKSIMFLLGLRDVAYWCVKGVRAFRYICKGKWTYVRASGLDTKKGGAIIKAFNIEFVYEIQHNSQPNIYSFKLENPKSFRLVYDKSIVHPATVQFQY